MIDPDEETAFVEGLIQKNEALEAALETAATNTIEHLTRIAALEAENARMQALLMAAWRMGGGLA